MRRTTAGRPAVVLLAAAVLLMACSSGSEGDGEGLGAASVDDSLAPTDTTAATADWTYPGVTWSEVDPDAAGFDQAGLDALAGEAEAARSTCLVVTREGELVDERYWHDGAADVPREAFSVTKSITSVLTGIAQDQELLSLDEPAANLIDEWQDTPSAEVTVANLLNNDSGRQWDLRTDYREMAALAPDKTAFATGLGQDAPPGEVWAYNNSAIQTLSAVLETATGEAPTAFAAEQLFEPVGMADSELTTDRSGGTLTFMGMQTTCLDLARFGYLLLRDGAWDGEQVVSAEYVEQATGQPSTLLAANYGLLFWLNHEGPIVSPRVATEADTGGSQTDGQMVPGAPDDVFWALGFNNQIVMVAPSEGIVAVRMGPAPPTETPFTQAELTTGVLDALR